RSQWLALRRRLSFRSLRKFTLCAEDDDGFVPMAEIHAVLDRNARTLRHLALGTYLTRHHSWDAVFQSSVIRTLMYLDLVDTRISRLVLGRVAHASALVSLMLHGTFEDVKGVTHTLLPHLHSFSFLLVGHNDQHLLYTAVAAFPAHRPLLRRLNLGSCPWELVRSLLPTLSGLKVLGVRIAHLNSAPAQGLWGALLRGVHALHLTTVMAESDLQPAFTPTARARLPPLVALSKCQRSQSATTFAWTSMHLLFLHSHNLLAACPPPACPQPAACLPARVAARLPACPQPACPLARNPPAACPPARACPLARLPRLLPDHMLPAAPLPVPASACTFRCASVNCGGTFTHAGSRPLLF
ncbi:hypothetical protein B0H14DRAFT_3706475, partial [Mycena olivaceomarginata]